MLLDHVKQRALLALPHSGSDGRQDIPQLRSIGARRGFASSRQDGLLFTCSASPVAWLAPEQTIVTSSCGLNHLPRQVAFGKLKAMTEAKRVLGG